MGGVRGSPAGAVSEAPSDGSLRRAETVGRSASLLSSLQQEDSKAKGRTALHGGYALIVGPVFHSSDRSADTWSQPTAEVCLSYEVNSGGLVAGHPFEACYALDFLAWTGD